jgi:hypothetical protein
MELSSSNFHGNGERAVPAAPPSKNDRKLLLPIFIYFTSFDSVKNFVSICFSAKISIIVTVSGYKLFMAYKTGVFFRLNTAPLAVS